MSIGYPLSLNQLYNGFKPSQIFIKMAESKNNFTKIPGGDNNTSWGYLIPIVKLIDFNNYGGKE